MTPPDPLLGELAAIKWLLVFIAACALGILAAFVMMVVNATGAMKENLRGARFQARNVEVEQLLASGRSLAAKSAALDWLKSEPHRVEAHWALARAHYQLGELSEAKQVVNAVLTIAPEEHYRVNDWLDLLDAQFSQRRPKPVG